MPQDYDRTQYGCSVEREAECQVVGSREIGAEKFRCKHQVTTARYGKELGESLHYSKNNCLKCSHLR